MARKIKAGGGKPPVFKGFKTVGGVKKKITGKGAHGTGLGLHGKGRKITAKGYTGKGAYGYGQGNHGVKPKPAGRGTAKMTKALGSLTTAKMVHPVAKPAAHAAGTRRAPGHTGITAAGGGKPPVRNPPGTKAPRTVKAPRTFRRPR